MYDPYLTWRSFLRRNFADYKKLPYKPHSVHVEIIPFIYGESKNSYLHPCIFLFPGIQYNLSISDCFQHNDITKYPDIGESLIHILGAIICGSQVCFMFLLYLSSTVNCNLFSSFNFSNYLNVYNIL